MNLDLILRVLQAALLESANVDAAEIHGDHLHVLLTDDGGGHQAEVELAAIQHD